jgi:hypothetical protein
VSLRQHLESSWDATGIKPALLIDEPELNPNIEHIWSWFFQLHHTRGGGMGPAPLTYQEMSAWSQLLQIEPTPWEISMVMMIDGVWLKTQSEKGCS